MYPVTTSIEIKASPADVRAKFLDFEKIPTYHLNGFFVSLGPGIPGTPLEPGVKMHNVLKGMTFNPEVLENSSTCFRWLGSTYGIFDGEHRFLYEPSDETEGGTRFVHEEHFTGLLAFLMGDNSIASWLGFKENTKKGFESYNRDLKAWCEGTSSYAS